MRKKAILIGFVIIILLLSIFQYINYNDKDDGLTEEGFNDYELIKDIISMTNETKIEDNIEFLQEQGTRYIGTDGNDRSTRWLKNKYDSFGLETYYQNFSYQGLELSNVIAYQEGIHEGRKSETIILCAHFDSINREDHNLSAPGADDDASGTAAIIESARILSKYNFNKTIMYCTWNAEEVGLIGSRYFAERIDEIDFDIKGVYNFDMIGYSENGENIALHSDHRSKNLLDMMVNMDKRLELPLNITPITEDPEKRSDHFSFWMRGYKACLVIEEKYNPYYHTTEDTIDKISISMVESVTRLAVSSTIKLSEIHGSKELFEDRKTAYLSFQNRVIELNRASFIRLKNK